MRRVFRLAVVLTSLGWNGAVQAQTVLSGTVRSQLSGQPLGGALLIVTDSSGRELMRTLSNAEGRFVIRPAGTPSFRVRILRVGHRPWQSEPMETVQQRTLDFQVPDQPVVLPSIDVSTSRQSCGIQGSGSALGMLLSEAQKALSITEAAAESRRHMFAVESWKRRLSPTLATLDSTSALSVDRGWPIQSAPPDSLRINGFVHDELDTLGNHSTVYFGPDARVLFADWFLRTRCLRIISSADAPGVLTVEFTPRVRSPGVDVSGAFVFDSITLALRELRFEWRGLASWIPRHGPGGYIMFRKLDSGEWLAIEWSLRAPVPEVTAEGRIRLKGYEEFGGRVGRTQ